MKKKFKLFLWLSLIIGVIYCIYASFNMLDYLNGDLKDAQKAGILHKKFINSISFAGIILEKKYCDYCDKRSKYQIIINLQEFDPDKISISNQVYPPQYTFDLVKKQLNISVSENLYNSIKQGALIKKDMFSDFIIWGNKKFRLISEKRYHWLPE